MGDATAGPAGEEYPKGKPAGRRGLRGRLGRDIGAAAGVGGALALAFLGALFFNKALFVALVVLLVGVGVAELTHALRPAGVRLPLIPLLAGVVAMLVGAYNGGTWLLAIVTGVTVLVLAFGRLAGGREGFVRDVTAGVFVTMYVPFLASFAVLLLRPADGALRVLIFVALAVVSDIGGYVAGVLFGRHKLAPHISPGKTWEGLAGSAGACLLIGWAGVTFLLQGPWWAGLVLGVAATLTATCGDLVESMIKRDVGIKDMGALLPGHGGLMDRLDSLLPTAMVSWVVLTPLVPVAMG